MPDFTKFSINEIMNLSIEQLFEINAPLLRKILDGQALTADERMLHEAILDEAQRRLNSLEQADRAERDARLAAR